MSTEEEGILIYFKAEHLLKTKSGILDKEGGISITSKNVHSTKTFFPI